MASKSTGKYYAPVYRAKKSPLKVRRIRLFKRCALIAAAITVAAVAIAAVQINRSESESFVKVAASEQSLADADLIDLTFPLSAHHVADGAHQRGCVEGLAKKPVRLAVIQQAACDARSGQRILNNLSVASQ